MTGFEVLLFVGYAVITLIFAVFIFKSLNDPRLDEPSLLSINNFEDFIVAFLLFALSLCLAAAWGMWLPLFAAIYALYLIFLGLRKLVDLISY